MSNRLKNRIESIENRIDTINLAEDLIIKRLIFDKIDHQNGLVHVCHENIRENGETIDRDVDYWDKFSF